MSTMSEKKKLEINKDFLFKEHFKPYEGGGKRKVKFLVLHHVGSKDLDNVEAAIDIFKRLDVSSHYIINQNGTIYQLVDENNIAWHAGTSYWKGSNGLNSESIGIEFHSLSPENIGFTKEQVKAGIKLCQDIISRHKVKQENVVGHSDVGYNKDTGYLDRKQDPSHLFPWKEFAKNGVGYFPRVRKSKRDNEIICKLGDKGSLVKELQKKLKDFGYKIIIDGDYGGQTESVVKVFKRRFEQENFNEDSGKKFFYSTYKKLNSLLKQMEK